MFCLVHPANSMTRLHGTRTEDGKRAVSVRNRLISTEGPWCRRSIYAADLDGDEDHRRPLRVQSRLHIRVFPRQDRLVRKHRRCKGSFRASAGDHFHHRQSVPKSVFCCRRWTATATSMSSPHLPPDYGGRVAWYENTDGVKGSFGRRASDLHQCVRCTPKSVLRS